MRQWFEFWNLRKLAAVASPVFMAVSLGVAAQRVSANDELSGATEFHRDIQPILTQYCYDCHGDGMNKGDVAFDEFNSDHDVLTNRDLWWKALKNLRTGIMPPEKKARPTEEEKQRIAEWIKSAVFEIDPLDPDPGRVTIRRLNRVEYRNTIRDLMGIDFDTEKEFPPDDAGHGFDNISDVLTLPPMLLEKFLDAANTIVTKAVPMTSRVIAETTIPGRNFNRFNGEEDGEGLVFSYYESSSVLGTFDVAQAGHYEVILDLRANEHYVDNQFDYNKCRLIFTVDGNELLRREFNREGGKAFQYVFDQDWQPGEHKMTFEVAPLTPDEKQIRSLTLRVDSVTIRGPFEEHYWVRPKNYERFFPKEPPTTAAERREYAAELLGGFAQKAFRRPVDNKTVGRLVDLAQDTYNQPGKSFEAGIAHAMTAVLASPRFLFREEGIVEGSGRQPHPLVDEYSLASRLSYFLWSSMPDDELFRLAGEGKLRKNLSSQVKRMMDDKRSEAFIKNFTGQWLQARDIESVQIDARAVLAREEKPDPEMDRMRKRFRDLRRKPDAELTKEEKEEMAQLRTKVFRGFNRNRTELTGELRRSMRKETEDYFEYVVRQDRNLLELLDSNYTFLNGPLAKLYGITNVFGEEMRRVTLPPDSPRGGILTQGTVLTVTSNPTRTSPVKRGVFILDNVLGSPPPPPPPNIPLLEDASKGITNHTPTLRETLALHRESALCSSCHNRMDPIGLAFENFNAMGEWRDSEFQEPIDATGKLITGEEFKNATDLKRILTTRHSLDFYRTLTEKLLTYALGRGLEYYDVETVDEIVARIEKSDGRPSALLTGVIESAPFQRTRNLSLQAEAVKPKTVEQRADAK
jgi:Protein of unknown function (DUF1592)/Protein of unknown function (DUF1588)/Protein of unknown function (DUF1587)/Protein of unknown function (DUF1585)/Protein of unknown function (DUF1595)/Cytochrome C oxidase, cbb3-type, subunit III